MSSGRKLSQKSKISRKFTYVFRNPYREIFILYNILFTVLTAQHTVPRPNIKTLGWIEFLKKISTRQIIIYCSLIVRMFVQRIQIQTDSGITALNRVPSKG